MNFGYTALLQSLGSTADRCTHKAIMLAVWDMEDTTGKSFKQILSDAEKEPKLLFSKVDDDLGLTPESLLTWIRAARKAEEGHV